MKSVAWRAVGTVPLDFVVPSSAIMRGRIPTISYEAFILVANHTTIIDAAKAAIDVGAFHFAQDLLARHGLDLCPLCLERPHECSIVFRRYALHICNQCWDQFGIRNKWVAFYPCVPAEDETMTRTAVHVHDYRGRVHDYRGNVREKDSEWPTHYWKEYA